MSPEEITTLVTTIADRHLKIVEAMVDKKLADFEDAMPQRMELAIVAALKSFFSLRRVAAIFGIIGVLMSVAERVSQWL